MVANTMGDDDDDDDDDDDGDDGRCHVRFIMMMLFLLMTDDYEVCDQYIEDGEDDGEDHGGWQPIRWPTVTVMVKGMIHDTVLLMLTDGYDYDKMRMMMMVDGC